MKKIVVLLGLLLSLGIVFSCNNDSKVINGKDGVDGKDGKNGKDGTNSGGNYGIVLFGDVTNEEAKEMIESSPIRINQIVVKNTTNLTELNFTNIEKVAEVIIFNNKALHKINFKKLEVVSGRVFIRKNEKMTSCIFPKLMRIEGDAIDNDSELEGLTIDENDNLTTIGFPNLEKCSDIQFGQESGGLGNKKMETIDFPKLIIANEIMFNNNKNLKSINFPKLEKCYSISIGTYSFDANENLEIVNFPELTSVNRIIIGKSNTKLKMSSVHFPKLKGVEIKRGW